MYMYEVYAVQIATNDGGFVIAENLCKELEQNEVRERILFETDPKWCIDMKQKDVEAPAASFRKLNVD